MPALAALFSFAEILIFGLMASGLVAATQYLWESPPDTSSGQLPWRASWQPSLTSLSCNPGKRFAERVLCRRPRA